MSTDTVNVRIDATVAEQLAQRAQRLGVSRQQLVDQILAREALTGGWTQPIALPPGLLPIADQLEGSDRNQHYVWLYRVRDTDPITLVLGSIRQVLPTILYISPRGRPAYPILRAHLLAWQPYGTEADLFDIIGPWIAEGAWLHPTVPSRWHQEQANWRARVLGTGRSG